MAHDRWWGGIAAASIYQLEGTIGQPEGGHQAVGGSYQLNGGYWGAAARPTTPSIYRSSNDHKRNSHTSLRSAQAGTDLTRIFYGEEKDSFI
ncbi:MAG: hypothetical protein H6651_11955 [Ardenticatenales bacterium]|nr:hypothetical protein [Ardenticatenales bacterium]